MLQKGLISLFFFQRNYPYNRVVFDYKFSLLNNIDY